MFFNIYMKRFSTILLSALSVIAVWAQSEPPLRLIETAVAGMSMDTNDIPQKPNTNQGLIPLEEGQTLQSSEKIINLPRQINKTAVTPSSLAGKWVMTYTSIAANSCSSGSSALVSVAAADSIMVTNFWISGAKAKIAIKEDGSLAIPSQIICNYGTYGDLYIANVDRYGTPHTDVEITGYIANDGSLVFNTWWGIFTATASDNVKANTLLGGYSPMKMVRANGEMKYTIETSSGTATYTSLVHAIQNQGNVLQVTNFLNAGQTVEFILNYDRTSTIEYQPALYTLDGTWYTIGNLRFNDSGNLSGYNFAINSDVAAQTDNRNITWQNWSLLCPDAKMYYGKIYNSTLTLDYDLRYPQYTATEFEGSGTENDPYLIKTPDQIALLAQKVNTDTELYYGTFTKSFIGKYFRLANDVDMAGLRTAPIGQTLYNRFAGTFDGNGKTISNLNINTYNRGMAGLFGCVDTLGTIKNLTIESPYVHTANDYAGSVAAFSLGKISNCHARNIDILNTAKATGGIVGVIGNDITGCTVDGGKLTSHVGYAGGITGEVDLHTLSDCHVDNLYMLVASGTNTFPNGGVVGYNYGSTVEKSSFTGTVDGMLTDTGMPVGGIAGSVYAGYVDRCFAVGTIKNGSINNDAITGGLVGTLSGNLTNSYSIGRVYGYANTASGGLTGQVKAFAVGTTVYQSTIKNCYTATSLVADTYLYDTENGVRETLGTFGVNAEPTIENIYFDRRITNLKSQKYGSTTPLLTSSAGPQGFDAATWTFTEGQYPRLKCQESSSAALFGASAAITDELDNLTSVARPVVLHPMGNTIYGLLDNDQFSQKGKFCRIENFKIVLGDRFGKDTLMVCNGSPDKASFIWPMDIAPVFLDGMGTIESPFLIQTKEDLIKLSVVTTEDKQLYTGVHFKMTNDIDLELDESYIGICSDTQDAYNKFAGIFDGAGHTLHNMLIRGVYWKTRPEDSADGKGTPDTDLTKSYRGFMGRLDAVGVIKNLNIANDCVYEGWGHVGAFVGNSWGTVENCRNYADVTGYSTNVGGIIGRMNKGAIVRNCYNAGNVSCGYQETGGIAASCAGIVENCVNTGNVRAASLSKFINDGDSRLNTAGGIVARSDGAILKNVVNFGSVYARISMAGGIAGRFTTSAGSGNNDLYGCLNFGIVSTPNLDLIGGISGQNATTGELKDNYWDAQILPIKASGNMDVEGLQGTTTSTLTSGTPLASLDASVWNFENGKYPVIAAFKDEPLVSLQRSFIVEMEPSENAYDLHSASQLKSTQGATWKLAFAKAFTIADNKLLPPANVTEMITDTLIALYNGNPIKSIEIRSAPAVPLSGNGSQQNPYLITSPDDWNALSDFMAASGKDMEGKWFSITADINFASQTCKPIADTGAAQFQGIILGNGHAIKNVAITTAKTYSGLFGTIGKSAIIRDISFEGTITSAYTYTGGIAGKLYGTLENVENHIDVISTKANSGGIAAYGYTGAHLNNVKTYSTVQTGGSTVGAFFSTTSAQPGITYINCQNYSTIKVTASSASNIGGYVGVGAPALFSGCLNDCKFEFATPANITAVAGFVANPTSTTDTLRYEFLNCVNKSPITAKAKIAGFTGMITSGKTILSFDSCINYGDITALSTTNASSSPVAGIAMQYTLGLNMVNCYNYATINGGKQQYVAGLLGNSAGNPTEAKPAIVRNSHNKGNSVSGVSYVAGIIAMGSTYTHLIDCSNTSEISGETFGVGGVAGGYSGTYSTIDGCWNTGNVTISLNRCGGIVGMNGPTAGGYVRNCWNAGYVKTTSTVQGVATGSSGYAIGGIAGTGAATYVNCYNLGTIEGASMIGGLIGQPSVNRTALYNCYNAGRIEAPADSCGNICGASLANTVIWKDGELGSNRIENVKYVTDYGTISRDNYGTPLSRAQLARVERDSIWTRTDRYSFPMLNRHAAIDAATLHAAQPIFAGVDNENKVTSDFHVGASDKVTWTINPNEAATLNGDTYNLKKGYIGKVTLTATLGNHSKSYNLAIEANGSGLSQTTGEIINELYFTLDGLRVENPISGTMYIVIRFYSDGSQKASKEVKQ